MKIKQLLFLIVAFVLVGAGFESVKAQTAPPFKISAIKIVPFEELTGEFGEEINSKDAREFFNDVSTGLLVTVEISGKTEMNAPNRQLEVTVVKGTKLFTKKLTTVFGVGAGGKYYVPLYVDGGNCQTVTITAKMVGQKTASTMTRKVSFVCGE